jgi:hypothetical protein
MTQDEIKKLAIKHGGTELKSYCSTSEGNTTAILFTVAELEAYTKAVEERTGVIDCRTCNFYHTLRGGCTCNTVCVAGDRYRGKDVVRLYKKVPE